MNPSNENSLTSSVPAVFSLSGRLFHELTRDEKKLLVNRLQQTRRELQAFSRRRRSSASSTRRKKKKKFIFNDPGCQALWDMAMKQFKEKLEKDEKKGEEKC